jgi:hypothetical protein
MPSAKKCKNVSLPASVYPDFAAIPYLRVYFDRYFD